MYVHKNWNRVYWWCSLCYFSVCLHIWVWSGSVKSGYWENFGGSYHWKEVGVWAIGGEFGHADSVIVGACRGLKGKTYLYWYNNQLSSLMSIPIIIHSSPSSSPLTTEDPLTSANFKTWLSHLSRLSTYGRIIWRFVLKLNTLKFKIVCELWRHQAPFHNSQSFGHWFIHHSYKTHSRQKKRKRLEDWVEDWRTNIWSTIKTEEQLVWIILLISLGCQTVDI